jgi:LytS/YehU family sensor histidine kinase
VIITHAYETVFLLRDWESDRLRRAHTERARLEAELEALGREVDPHFLFNHLNALVHLVEQKSDAAPAFVTALGDTYRYVIESRGCRLVPLSRELDALRRHEMLARIRYGDRIRLSVSITAEDAARFLLPPVSLGELFNNAIKHNDSQPALHIDLALEGYTLLFTNDYRPARGGRIESTGVGLSNLAQRFTLATGRNVVCGRSGDRYVVRVPLAPSS